MILGVGIFIALTTASRLVREASRMSPLEASRRVTRSEGESVRVRFGVLQFLALFRRQIIHDSLHRRHLLLHLLDQVI